MSEMTSKERFLRMFDHKEADRVPVIDSPWAATVERWHSEGLPRDCSYSEYCGLDNIYGINVDNSPRYPVEVLEEAADYKVQTNSWGVKMKNWSTHGGTPEFLDFTIVDRDSWQKAKARMHPSDDRIDWDFLKNNYSEWRRSGSFITAGLFFGFDVTHSWVAGTERCLMAMIEDPEWLMEIYSTQLDLNLELLDRIWNAGYEFDAIFWCDDMAYKEKQFFSVDTYRTLLKPFHKRAVDWAHEKGIKARLHSCGKVSPFIPELIEIGIDGLNPLEVKAGMDPVALKKTYGKELLFHGGINAQLYDRPDEIKAEMERVIPKMKEAGGYIFSSDHSVPDSVSLKDFCEIVSLGKKLGTYS